MFVESSGTHPASAPPARNQPNQAHSSIPGRGGAFNFIRILKKRKYFILLVLALSFAAAVAVTHLMAPVYEAAVLLEILPDSNSGGDLISGAVSSLIGGDALKPEVQTQVQVLRGNAVALDVIKALDLRNRSPFKYTPGRFRINEQILAEQNRPLDQAPTTRARLIGILQSELDIQPIPNTRLISVKVSGPDAQLATDIANALINSLIKNHLQVRYGTVQQATDWMSGQLTSLQRKVELSQQKLADFERQTGLFGVSVSSGDSADGKTGPSAMSVHSPILDRLASLNAERTTAEAARISKEAIYRLTLSQNPDVVIGLGTSDLARSSGFAQGPQGDSLALLQTLRAQEASLKLQYADAATKYGANNPHLSELQSQVKQLDVQMLEEIKRISQRAKNDYDLALATEQGVDRAFDLESKKATQVNGDALRAQILAEEASSNRLLYDQLYARLQQAGVVVGLQGTNIDVVDPALLPPSPKWPNSRLNLALAAVGGLVFAVGLSILLENMRDTLATPREIEVFTGLYLYGSIPRFDLESQRRRPYGVGTRYSSHGSASEQLPEVDDVAWVLRKPRSIISEAYRTLRTAILLSSPAGSLKTLMVTSPAPSDGKSTTCYNLAMALAKGGRKVLIIDTDLRRPRLHQLFKVGQNPGLSNVISGGVSLKEAIVSHHLERNLSLLPSGPIPPNPAELLGSQLFEDILSKVRSEYDLVLLDSTPDTIVSDSVIVGSHADMILLICRANVTRYRQLEQALRILQRQCPQAHLALVLNAVDTASADYQYEYGYYGRGAYYGEQSENH